MTSNHAMQPSVSVVTPRACARVAPTRPALIAVVRFTTRGSRAMATARKPVVLAVLMTTAALTSGHYAWTRFEHASELGKTSMYLRDSIRLAWKLEAYRRQHSAYPVATDWASLNEQVDAFRSHSAFETGLTYLSCSRRHGAQNGRLLEVVDAFCLLTPAHPGAAALPRALMTVTGSAGGGAITGCRSGDVRTTQRMLDIDRAFALPRYAQASGMAISTSSLLSGTSLGSFRYVSRPRRAGLRPFSSTRLNSAE